MHKKGRINESPVLETERLFLRKFRLEDSADVFSYASNEDVARFVTWDAHKTEENSIAFLKWILAKYENEEPADWAIIDKVNGQVIGSIGLVFVEESNRCCEVGYALSEKFWGKGYTTEALDRVVKFLFEECDINRIQATCAIQNIGSKRVMEKTGLLFEGILRQRMFVKNTKWDVNLYAILKEDWQKTHLPDNKEKDKVFIEEADFSDLSEILAIQKKAYRTEADIYGDSIAPMVQTIEMMESSFYDYLFLKAVLGNRIIGSIRLRTAEGTCYIGRLIVEPEFQHQGIGRHLLHTAEALYKGMRFELFTGHLSKRNIELYEKEGYKPFKTVKMGDRETLLYLEK